MGSSWGRWVLVGVALVLAGAAAGYVGSAALDEDVTSGRAEPTTDTTTDGGDATSPSDAAPDGLPIVVSSYGVVGWWDGAAWQRVTDAPAPVQAGARYRFVGLTGGRELATGAAASSTCAIADDGHQYVELDRPFEAPGAIPLVAVTGVPDPLPRPVEDLDLDSDTYRTAAKEALAGVGIDDGDPELTQLLRTDLDGDGSDEVLLTVARRPLDDPVDARRGDYSAVILRRVVGGAVRTEVVAHSAIGDGEGNDDVQILDVFRIAAVADLNGDDQLEVAIESRYYEGGGIELWAQRGEGALAVVAGIGCGV